MQAQRVDAKSAGIGTKRSCRVTLGILLGARAIPVTFAKTPEADSDLIQSS